ncbi:hypothetical protein DL89DRAFT_263682 [Linderina pennispora]|uniref:CoA-dependent acyltransferase n=1 Tax=Linderina pennispora TaxID=61395 RepID=A0A1Y1WJJ3_9FUNG|nr:uncharacterized protein DL89DRAFT_263682 [Linderina pennispora]ORX73652.1 hypothetical protein DL89DRAFT_263682 [Linderina pennispora]
MLFFYANDASDEDFMPGDKLEEGFYRTLSLCPWFAGDLQADTRRTNLNMPAYRESQSLVHFSKIQSVGFNPTTWPSDLVPVEQAPYLDSATRKVKLLRVHVVRLKDNSGMAISISFNHGIADGTTIMTLLNRWADETRALIAGVPVAEATFCFGADIISKHLPSERAPLNETTSKVLSAKSRVADFIMLASYLTSPASPRGHLFRISRAKIDGLRSQVLEHLPHGTRVHEQAVTMTSRGWVAKLADWINGAAGEHWTLVVVDYRRHLGMAELNYMGNPIFGEFVLTPLHQAHQPITAKTIAVTHAINSLAIAMNYKVVTTTTNIASTKMYAADFGQWRVFIILPSPPPSKDILVNICDTPSVMDGVLKNEFWRDFAELVY